MSFILTLDGYVLCAGCCPQAGDRYSLEEKPHTSPDGDTFHSIIHSTGSLSTYCAPGSKSGAGDRQSMALMEAFFQWEDRQ